MLAHKSLNLNAVAEQFDVSRPAISKHIKLLTECGLISIRPQGRERVCEARLEKLSEVSDWVEQYRKFWNNKLDALENYLHTLQSSPGQESATSKSLPSSSPTTKKKKHGKRK